MDKVNITISDHAKERLKERVGCKDSKLLKIVKKAWDSKEKVDMNTVANAKSHENSHSVKTEYRKLMGMIYVFRVPNEKTIILVTIMPPTTKMARKRSLNKPYLGNKHEEQRHKNTYGIQNIRGDVQRRESD